jgi:hypothetical protein
MFKWLKKHFIPHPGNNHRPHFLHGRTLKKVVGILVFVELILFVLPTLNFAEYARNLNLGAVLPGVLSALTNEERGKYNLPELSADSLLEKAAQLKAEDMATKGYFAHNSPEGLTPWYWFEKVGYGYFYAGENLAVNFTDSHEVTEAWMRSPTHQANIVNKNYTEVGTGIATGVYKGREAVFVAQLYASPSPKFVTTRVTASVPNVTQSEPEQTPANLGEEVLGEQSAQIPNYLKSLMSSPRETTGAVLLTALIIVLAALILNIVLKFEHHHPDLIWNGTLVCLVIALLYFGNGLYARDAVETSFLDFSQSAAQVSTL